MAEGRLPGSEEEEMELPQSETMARPGISQEPPATQSFGRQRLDPASATTPELSTLTITDYAGESDLQRALRLYSTCPPPTASRNRPTTEISASGKVSTEYRGKQLPPQTTESTPETPAELSPENPPHLEPTLQHTSRDDSGAEGRDIGHRSSEPVKKQPKTPSISSGEIAKEIAEEMHQTKEKFFQIKTLAMEAKPSLPEKINLKCLPILYHENYNLKLVGKIRVNHRFMLVDKPAKIFAKLQEDLFEKCNCDCVEVEVTDFQDYSDDSYSVIPDAVKKRDIDEVTKILKVKFPELYYTAPEKYGRLMHPSWSVFDSAMLYPLRLQVNGSLQACGVAMKMGWAIHIGGGFGYNSTTFSKGLAVYDDILHCLLTLPESVPGHDIKYVLIINYEARQSPNYKHIREIKFPVAILDFYLERIPESEKAPSQYDNELVVYKPIKIEGKNAAAHVGIALRKISSFIVSTKTLPSLCIYIAGTDIIDHPGKPSFQQKHVVHRDLEVFNIIQTENNIPIAIIVGGGNKEIDVMAAAASITELCKIGRETLNLDCVVDKSKN